MTTINSVPQLHTAAATHGPRPAQPQRGTHGKQPAQSQTSTRTDGDGDHGIEPGGAKTGQLVNVKG